jgi:hypothetical protein
MREFLYEDHAGDEIRAFPLGESICGCDPGAVRIDAHSVHLPIPQQRALAKWLIDHLVKVRPGEDVSLVLPNPQAVPATLEVQAAPGRPSGYLLTLSVEGAELSVSDDVSPSSMEMQMLIDAAGRAMERFRLDLDAPTPQAADDLDEFLGRLADALHVHSDDGFGADELIAGVEQLYANNARHQDGYVRASEKLEARHREMAKALGASADATFSQLVGVAMRAVAQPELKQLRALMPPQVVSGQDGSMMGYFTDLAAQWKQIREALHAAGRPQNARPSDTAATVVNVIKAERHLVDAHDKLLARANVLEEALERVRAEFFDIEGEPYVGHVSADFSRAIVAKIDKALSGEQG